MKRVAVIRGDGVGPELTRATLDVLSCLDLNIDFLECEAGYEYWLNHGGDSLIPPQTWEILEHSQACLKAPTTTPSEPEAPPSVAITLRKRFDLYANIRPIRSYPGITKYGELDFVCLRENTEDLYFGVEFFADPNTCIALRRISRSCCRRIAEFGCQLALKLGYRGLVAIHKANVLRRSCGLFLEELRQTLKNHPELELWEYHIDNMAHQLVKNPAQFNRRVLISTNLFMDIISEEAAALVGSVGLVPSANIGDRYGMFEPLHGSAPKYKGMDKLNPSAMILAAGMLLDYLGYGFQAKLIQEAVERVIAERKLVTYDLGGTASTSQMAQGIASKIQQLKDQGWKPGQG